MRDSLLSTSSTLRHPRKPRVREETVAAIFDGPKASPPPAVKTRDYGDVIEWGKQKLAFERERRSRRRRRSEHVFAETTLDDATVGSSERASPDG